MDELEHTANFLRFAEEIVLKHPNEYLRYESLSDRARKVCSDARALKEKHDNQTVLRGLIVQSNALFEQYIRKAVEDVLHWHENNGQVLPVAVKNSNLYFTGRGFCLVYDGVGERKLDFQEMARNIATCFTDDQETKLNKAAASAFVGQCTHQSIDATFNKVDIRDIWTAVSREKEIRGVLGAKAQKETEKLIEERLKMYLRMRNGIAHGAEGFESVSYEECFEALGFYRALIVSFDSCIRKRIGKNDGS